MALPASGPIALNQILTEFGAPQNTPFTQMVKGGLYVPANVASATIPAAVPIAITQFRGAYKPAAVSASFVNPNNCTLSQSGSGTLNVTASLTHASQSGDTFALVEDISVYLRISILSAPPAPKLVLHPRAANGSVAGNIRHQSSSDQGSMLMEPGASGVRFFASNDGRSYYCDNPDYYYGVPGGTPGMDDIDCEQNVTSGCSKTVPTSALPSNANYGDVLTSAAAAGQTFDLWFNLGRRVIRAFVGGKTSYGQTVTWSAGGFGSTFEYELAFINGSTLIQAVPLKARIQLYGNLSATAVIYP